MNKNICTPIFSIFRGDHHKPSVKRFPFSWLGNWTGLSRDSCQARTRNGGKTRKRFFGSDQRLYRPLSTGMDISETEFSTSATDLSDPRKGIRHIFEKIIFSRVLPTVGKIQYNCARQTKSFQAYFLLFFSLFVLACFLHRTKWFYLPPCFGRTT